MTLNYATNRRTLRTRGKHTAPRNTKPNRLVTENHHLVEQACTHVQRWAKPRTTIREATAETVKRLPYSYARTSKGGPSHKGGSSQERRNSKYNDERGKAATKTKIGTNN